METQLYKGLLTQTALTDQDRDILLSQGWSLTRDPLTPDVNLPVLPPQPPVESTFHQRLLAVERALGISSAQPKFQREHAAVIAKHTNDMTFALTERNRLAAQAAQTGTIADVPSTYTTGPALAGTVNTAGANFTWVSGDTFPSDLLGIEINGVGYTISLIADDGLSGVLTKDAGTQTGVLFKA